MTKSTEASFKIICFGAKDCGFVRTHNEDQLWYSGEKMIFAVADGLGGLPEGEKASLEAVRAIENAVSNENVLSPEALFNIASSAVYSLGKQIRPNELGVATTLTIGCISGNTLSIAHAGDSGVLHCKQDGSIIKQVTKDDTMAAEFLSQINDDEKDIDIPDFYKNTLTRCLGTYEKTTHSNYEEKLHPGDCLLFYTDGLTKVLNMEETAQFIKKSPTPQALVQNLIQEVTDRGAPDNITLIAVFIE